MSKPVARIGDKVIGTCKAPASGHPRAFTGTWQTGSSLCTADGLGIVRVDDTGITDCGHQFKAIVGSDLATCEGRKIVRVGDAVQVILGGDGTANTGSPTISTD